MTHKLTKSDFRQELNYPREFVEKILAAKKAKPPADTLAWEREIDKLVYGLYELTADEIAIVEGGEIKRQSIFYLKQQSMESN